MKYGCNGMQYGCMSEMKMGGWKCIQKDVLRWREGFDLLIQKGEKFGTLNQ